MTAETEAKFASLRGELALVDGAMGNCERSLGAALDRADSDAIFHARSHAEWAAKRAELIRKFFEEC